MEFAIKLGTGFLGSDDQGNLRAVGEVADAWHFDDEEEAKEFAHAHFSPAPWSLVSVEGCVA
jgi:hypothetical protein